MLTWIDSGCLPALLAGTPPVGPIRNPYRPFKPADPALPYKCAKTESTRGASLKRAKNGVG